MNPQHIVYICLFLVGTGIIICAVDPLKPEQKQIDKIWMNSEIINPEDYYINCITYKDLENQLHMRCFTQKKGSFIDVTETMKNNNFEGVTWEDVDGDGKYEWVFSAKSSGKELAEITVTTHLLAQNIIFKSEGTKMYLLEKGQDSDYRNPAMTHEFVNMFIMINGLTLMIIGIMNIIEGFKNNDVKDESLLLVNDPLSITDKTITLPHKAFTDMYDIRDSRQYWRRSQ